MFQQKSAAQSPVNAATLGLFAPQRLDGIKMCSAAGRKIAEANADQAGKAEGQEHHQRIRQERHAQIGSAQRGQS